MTATLVIDINTNRVTYHGQTHSLTNLELTILTVLAIKAGTRQRRRDIILAAWGDDLVDPHVLDIHLANAKRKLMTGVAADWCVMTIRAYGFTLDLPPDEIEIKGDPSIIVYGLQSNCVTCPHCQHSFVPESVS